jgi:F-type H+-transporting ATPase subunit epsilon
MGDIDRERAEAAMERAEKRLEDDRKEKVDIARANAALERAMVRIKIAGLS